jgi:hypothetical protein
MQKIIIIDTATNLSSNIVFIFIDVVVLSFIEHFAILSRPNADFAVRRVNGFSRHPSDGKTSRLMGFSEPT